MRTFLTLVAMLAAAGLYAPAASAQGRPGRPYRGLFAGGVSETEQSLTVRGAFGGGYDDNILADGSGIGGGGGGFDPRIQRRGNLLMANGAVDYSLSRDTFGMFVSGATSSRYYPKTENPLASAHTGAAGMNWRMGRRTSLFAQGFAIYQPFTLSGVFPTALGADFGSFEPIGGPNLDLTATTDRYLLNSGAVNLRQTLTRRTSLFLSYSKAYSDSSAYQFSYSNDSAAGGYLFQVNNNLGLRFGYGYMEGRFQDGSNRYTNQNFDVGVNYTKALSVSRRTTFSFGTGSTAISDGETTRFQAIGSARLNHEIGRTWHASVAYDRNVGFIESLRQPVFTDAVTSQLDGLISRRLEFTANAQASFGQLGMSSSAGSGFTTYYGATGLQYALTRNISLSANYFYYRYDFDSRLLLPQGVTQHVNRQSVRGSVNLWAPLFQRARRTNVTR
jgi:hypothetical protein